LWAGRLTEQKGYKELADIINTLSISTSSSIQWLIAGSGEDHEEIYRLLGASPFVSLLGHVPHDGVLSLMSTSDIFLSTSIWESWPNVIIEALHSGITIVASDIPGHSDMLLNQPHSYLYKSTDHALSILRFLISRQLERRHHWLPVESNSRIVNRMYDELFSHFE
jgi:glycosyltransferase involved in cell wall biosynthesis